MKSLMLVTSLILLSCMPREREVMTSLPQALPQPPASQLSPAAEQQIADCERNVQSTMTEFHLKNTDGSETTRKAENNLFEQEQSVCDRIRERYGVTAQNSGVEGQWGGDRPFDNNGYYQDTTARDVLTGAALGAGATYLWNRNRRQPASNTYSNQPSDDARYRNSQDYRKPAPKVAPTRRYARPSRGIFRGRRR
jgi:hypothetical protein